MARIAGGLFAVLAALSCVTSAAAQCLTGWASTDAWPGVSGTSVYATAMWDPDGAGPLPERLVVGGQFNLAGSGPAANIAMFDPATGTWSPVGSGTNGAVRALLTMPNGDLVAGGDFGIAGGVATAGVARWNGTSWSSIGSTTPLPFTISYSTHSLALLSNGDIVAGGAYMDWGGGVNGLMRWNGSSWAQFGPVSGSTGTVHVMKTTPSGDLVIGGTFGYVAGQSISRIARWNGSSWAGFGAGGPVGYVYALAAMPNGDICAAGLPAVQFDPSPVFRWNGTSWSQLGTGMNGAVMAMHVLANGDLVATGGFGGVVSKWNGTTWSSFGTGLGIATGRTLRELASGELVLGGSVPTGVVRWNGTAWSSFGGKGLDGSISSMTTLPNGDVVAGGFFVTADDGLIVNRIARFDGTSWSALGAGSASLVAAVTSLANGDVIASGSFTTPTGTHGVAQWDGSSWTGLGSVTGNVWKLVTTTSGEVLAAGSSNLTIGGVALHGLGKWNGTSWSGFGTGFDNNAVYAATTLPNGDVVAGGYFTAAGGTPVNRIARWDGAAWQPLGSGMDSTVFALGILPNGDLVAAGEFTAAGGTPASRVARWNGSVWSGLGTGTNGRVDAMQVLPDGDVVVGGWFTTAGGIAANRIARWNGSTWSSIGTGLNAPCAAISNLSATGLAVSGSFTDAGGLLARGFARVVTTCPPAATTVGNGCASSGGTNTLIADAPPWVDATFSATATGLPANALLVALTSVTSIPQGVAPLASIFAEGIPGCDVLVAPDILAASTTTTGTATSSFYLPNTPPIVGVTFFHQMIPFEIGGAGVVAITATNALQLTPGTF